MLQQKKLEEEYRFPRQTMPWAWEGMLSVSVARKSALRYNESNWRQRKSTEDNTQMLQVWSRGRNGVKGSQNGYRLVCHRGREEVKYWWGSSWNRELQWNDQRRANISDPEKRESFLCRKRWWWPEEAEWVKAARAGMRGEDLPFSQKTQMGCLSKQPVAMR